jgi:hypothetical protein
MAIRIPILTSFDPKGLRQANAQFAKLQSSVGSLGRNFAAAGAVIAGAGVLIGRSLRDAADSQRVFAQTEATLKSTGTTANGTAKEIAGLAASLQKSTAFNDEAILSGQNLLLTFKGIQNQAGEGNDIFNQASATMLDFARAMNTGPSEAAIKLGKALQDPTRGVTALRKSGVDFTKDQMEMIKSLQESGDLMGAQKIVLAELQSQFGGSAAAFANTFTGQLESMNNELNDLSEEIGFMVMPAVQGLIAEFRDLIPVIGPQLKAAIESVDIPALVTSVVNLTKFLVENATTIANSVVAIFALNTAFKAMQVISGLVSVALSVKTWWLAKAATGMTNAAIATGIFSTALKTIPFVAIVAGLGTIAAAMIAVRDDARLASAEVKKVYDDTKAELIADPWKQAQNPAKVYIGLIRDAVQTKFDNHRISINQIERAWENAQRAAATYAGSAAGQGVNTSTLAGVMAISGPISTPVVTRTTTTTGAAPKPAASPLQQIIADSKQNAKVIQKQSVLERKGLSKEVAAWVTSSNKPVKAANEAIARITKNGNKAIGNLTKAYTNSAAGQAAAAAAAASTITESFTVAYDDTADKEAAALAERQRVFQSFADSVKNTFAGIKNSILGAFELNELGGSTNAITRNMDKLLVRLRAFATNVKSLAGMGLDPALLQQVISAGPMAGARLAETLVMGGTGALAAINARYSEFGVLSGQIAQTGTETLFNRESQQNVYNINVDGGVGSGSTIGKAIVDAIKAYERTSGAVWQGA